MQFNDMWLDKDRNNLHIEVQGNLLFGLFRDLQSYIFDLKENPPQNITFDLSSVDLIDSSGLGLLIIANDITGDDGVVTLKHPTENVSKLFQVCKMHELMKIVSHA